MGKYLIEGSCDGELFAETIEADNIEEAEALAVERLCEAWGESYGPDTTLDDLGDAASVREYGPEDYLREAGPAMLAALRAILPHVSHEVEQRKEGGNDEDYADLEAVEAQIINAIRSADGKPTLQQENCLSGLHSWIGETGKLPADTRCTHCGEPYGDPA